MQFEEFELEHFFPYLVRVYYRDVSACVASVYARQYDLTVHEWRVMAVLGKYDLLTAGQVVDKSSLDKVQVSRGIKGLMNKGYLDRNVDEADRRKVNLGLTKEGLAIYRNLIPEVLKVQDELLSVLSTEETDVLKNLMEKVRSKAEQMHKDAQTE